MSTLRILTSITIVLQFGFGACADNLSLIDLEPLNYPGNNTISTRQIQPLTFYKSDIKVDWLNALDLCRSRGMKLLTITTPYIDNEIQQALRRLGSYSVWTSGNDLKKLHVYKWETTDSFILYSNWRNGFPSDSISSGCIAVSNEGACGQVGTYGWDKHPCEAFHYAFCH